MWDTPINMLRGEEWKVRPAASAGHPITWGDQKKAGPFVSLRQFIWLERSKEMTGWLIGHLNMLWDMFSGSGSSISLIPSAMAWGLPNTTHKPIWKQWDTLFLFSFFFFLLLFTLSFLESHIWGFCLPSGGLAQSSREAVYLKDECPVPICTGVKMLIRASAPWWWWWLRYSTEMKMWGGQENNNSCSCVLPSRAPETPTTA